MFFMNLRDVKLSDDQQECVRAVLSLNQAVGVAGGRFDEGFTIHFVSEFFLALVGHTDETLREATGGSYLNLVDPRDRASLAIDAFRNNGGARHYRLRHRNGSIVPVTEYRLAAKSEDGTPCWVISVRANSHEVNLADPIAYTMDFEGREEPVVRWSSGMYRFFGEKAQALQDAPAAWLEWVHEGDRLRLQALWKSLVKGEYLRPQYSEEFRIKNRRGEYCTVASRVSVLRNDDGSARRIIGVANPVDTYESLRRDVETAEHERDLYASFHDAITETNLCEFYVNLETGGYHCFKAEAPFTDVIAAHPQWSDLLHAYFKNCVQPESEAEARSGYDVETIRREFAAGRREHSFESHVLVEGRERWIENVVIACADEAGSRADHLVVYWRDETAAVLERRARPRMHHELEDLMSSINVGIYTVEKRLGEPALMMADRTMKRLLELTDDVTPAQCHEAWLAKVHPDDRALLAEADQTLSATGRMEVTYRWQSVKGWIWVRCGGVLDKAFADGVRFKGYHRDVSDIVAREERGRAALKAALSAANAASAAKAEFLANMSHDIRTPLNGVIGMTSIALASMDDPEKLKSALSKIEEAGRHLSTLLNGILSLSKINAGDEASLDAEVNLKKLLENTAELFTVQASTRCQTLRLQLEGIKHSVVVASPGRLHCVISSLIENAVKFTPVGGSVTVSVAEREASSPQTAFFEVVVEDSGIGMSEDFQKKLFEPFMRSPEAVQKRIEGSGLGLAIADSVARQLGGSLKITSRLGEGTRCVFTCELKIADLPELEAPQAAKTKATEAAAEAAAKESGAPVVMVVDDNELNLEIATEFVRMTGAEPVAVTRGEDAVHRFISSPMGRFSLILMDIQMPGLSGCQAAQAIRASGRRDANVPIIALSANAFADDIAAAKAAGMNEFLTKPVILPKLVEILEKYVKLS